MQKITLTRKARSANIGHILIDASIDWRFTEANHAIVRVHTPFCMNCMLHISPYIQGTIFEFFHQGISFSLSVDKIILHDGEIVTMRFFSESNW